jgi:hypothetical protein
MVPGRGVENDFASFVSSPKSKQVLRVPESEFVRVQALKREREREREREGGRDERGGLIFGKVGERRQVGCQGQGGLKLKLGRWSRLEVQG